MYYHWAMKLSDYAKKVGVSYRTARRWFKAGLIDGYQMQTGTIIITESDLRQTAEEKVAIYARVSSEENRANLDSQAESLVAYCNARGYQVEQVVKEIGSPINDNRPELTKLLKNNTMTIIVVEDKERLTRFGFNYIDILLQGQGRRIEVVNKSQEARRADEEKEDLRNDLVSIIYSFGARLYGQRRAKRKTEEITQIALDTE